MATPNHGVEAIIEILANRIGKTAFVYKGWPNDKHVKELRKTRGLSENQEVPEISLTEIHFLVFNVWAQTSRERDEVSQSVIDI